MNTLAGSLIAVAVFTVGLGYVARRLGVFADTFEPNLTVEDVTPPEPCHPEFTLEAWKATLELDAPFTNAEGITVIPPYLWTPFQRALVVLASPDNLTPLDLGFRDSSGEPAGPQ